MQPRYVFAQLVLVSLLSSFTAEPALARGGRFSAPAGSTARSAAADEGERADAPPASSPGCDSGVGPSELPDATPLLPGTKIPSLGQSGRRAACRTIGLADWRYWYDANREEFEDLGRPVHLTEVNPLFAIGDAQGARVGRPERRLAADALASVRTSVHDVLVGDNDHWLYTEGAAYVALGKIAERSEEVEILYRALRSEADVPEYVRESAALALGQLRRTETRRQLTGSTLDPARVALRALLADPKAALRTRAFAAVSLGLLSDQPSSNEELGAGTATFLLRTWIGSDLPDEVQVGILVGLGLHRPADVGATVRSVLKGCLLRGRLGSRTCSALVRAHAALAIGRIGTAADAPLLARALVGRDTASPALQQGTVIAAGTMARRLPATGVDLGRALLAARVQSKSPTGRNLAMIALGRALGAQVAGGGDDLLRGARAGARLLTAATDGDVDERAFAALSLALAVRPVDERVDAAAWQAFRSRALGVLRAGARDEQLDGHVRAAFATALGLTRDARSGAYLRGLLSDTDRDPELRAHAGLALGLIGEATQEVLYALTAAVKDARSDLLRKRATTALGLLGGGKVEDRERVIAILLEQLRVTRDQHVKGQIAITLARLGDVRAVQPLVGMLETRGEPHLNRSVACAALGLLGDEERTPVMSATRCGSYYLSGSSVVLDLLDVL